MQTRELNAKLSLIFSACFCLALSACSKAKTCGAGTSTSGDQCVVDQAAATTCGAGTTLDGGVCVATTACGYGTVLDGGVCAQDSSLEALWGISTPEKYDSSGTTVLPSTTSRNYVYVQTGISFLATATQNGLHVFDYDAVQTCINTDAGCPANNTFLPILSKMMDTPIADGGTKTTWSSHGGAMSRDGKWYYMSYLVPYARPSYVSYNPPATWFHKINALTLKPEKRIECGGPTHHANLVSDKYIMTECYSKAGLIWLDPENDDKVAKVFPYGQFEGYPYLSFESPEMTFIDAGVRYLATTVMGHLNNFTPIDGGMPEEIPGHVSFVNVGTQKEEATAVTGPFPIWVVFNKAGTMAWTSSAEDEMVRRIALSKNSSTGKLKAEVKAAIRVGPGPYGLALNADETKLFVDDKGEGVKAGSTTVHGTTITVVDTNAASPTYDQVLYTLGLSTDNSTSPHRPDHIYWGPDNRIWQCSNANQSCQVIDPNVTPDGGTMTTCTRVRRAHELPVCGADTDCPTGLACDAGLCGGYYVKKESIACVQGFVRATLRMPDTNEVSGWTVGRGDPHALTWVQYNSAGVGKVVQDFTKHE